MRVLGFEGKLRSYDSVLIAALRVSLGLIFFWFGALKVVGYVPQGLFELLDATFPSLAQGAGVIALGVVEVLIGVGLLINKARIITHTALVLHLTGTFSTFILGPEVIFNPRFPYLTLAGEFVFKNTALVVAGLVVLAHYKPKGNSAIMRSAKL